MQTYRNSYKQEDWQNAQFEQLLIFDEFCQKHNLAYSLDFGSLIGAIRHRGYIPWDNDIDVTMMPDQYEKLLDLAVAGKLPEGYELLAPRTDPDYQIDFARFIDTKTSCLLDALGWLNNKNGLFIDVFSLRPLPRDKRQADKAIRDFLVYEEGRSQLYRRAGNRTNAFKFRYLQMLAVWKVFGKHKALSWIKKQADKRLSDNPEWYMINSGGYYNGFALRKREWVESIIRVPVKGYMLPVFTGYLEILRGDYGDGWRYWPTEDGEFSPYRANLNIPGDFFCQDYIQTLNRKQAVSTLKEYKNLQIRDMMVRSRYSPKIYEAKGLLSLARIPSNYTEAELQNFIESIPSATIEEARGIAAAFEDFYTVQSGERYRYWNVAIPIKRTWLLAALWALLIVRRDYWTAKIILDLQLKSNRYEQLERSTDIKTLQNLLNAISDMHLAMDKNDIEETKRNLSAIEQICPDSHDRRIGSIWIASKTSPSAVESDKRLQEDYENEQDDGEYLAYYSDAIEQLNRLEEATEVRLRALNLTTNGMVIQSIHDKLGR